MAPCSWAGAATSVYDRLSTINDSLDQIESASLRSQPASVSERVAKPIASSEPSVSYASQYAKKAVAASPATGGSGASVLSDGWQKAFKVAGEIRMGVGVEDSTVFWRAADGNLNERDWRMLDNNALNRSESTFDPAVYSRLKIVLDAVVEASVRMHLNVTVDPWSYTGKSQPQTVTGSWGNDALTVQYLTWGSTRYTMGRILNTNLLGDSATLPELKIANGRVPATSILGNWGPYNDRFNIPSAEIDYTFNPLRELWFDFRIPDKGYVRVFPMAYGEQALTSDDPLRLSNNKMYWEVSPWLKDWTSGNLNRNATPVSFTKGRWDGSLANLGRDSDGAWLTALRGVTIDTKTNEEGTLRATVATPKNLWQDYGDVTAVPGSIRWKQFLADRLFFGVTGNMHLGMVNNSRIDAENYVKSADIGAVPFEGMEISAQVSSSNSVMDETTPAYETKYRGNAYYGSIEFATDGEDVLNKDYFALTPPEGAAAFAKTRFFFGMMEEDFESSLSNYHETRDDSFWSRHLTFYPSPYRNLPGTSPVMSHYDVEPFAIGNGLDYGRKVFGWRGDVSLLEDRLKGLGDTRYVMTDDDQRIETVSRTQWEYQATDRLLAKTLLLRQDLRDTTAGKDPFIVDGDTGEALDNDAVPGGEDPSLNTGTLGLRYQLTDRIAWNGVWERTNDFTVAANNYPNWIMNERYNDTYSDNGRVYNYKVPFLYSQGYFDQAPYDYHNIWKTGIEFNVTNAWSVYLDYARNPNKFAGNIDDNSNHFGLESSYVPNDKWGFFGRYTFSRMYAMDTLVNDDRLDYHSFHNFYTEARYCHSKNSKLSLLYGVGPAYNIGVQGINPSLAFYSTPTVDTQHIVRLIYQQKF